MTNTLPADGPLGNSRAGADFEWVIGADADCRVRIPSAHPRVALLIKRNTRLFLRNLGPGETILVNETPVPPSAETELTRYDRVQVGQTTLEIGLELFLGQARWGIDTSRLSYRRPEAPDQVLCAGAFLRAAPGTFTAILGPTGCGKTVFLNLLNGYCQPGQGRIVVGNAFDLQRDFGWVRNLVAFVPQGDILIAELTVRQSLDYRLRLRFPDMVERVRRRLIRDTCVRLGFHPSRLEQFLNTPVGSPEANRRGLSGGERKRANIAHELVMKPAILMLDEPTSGLSSADADQVTHLLRRLAAEEHITVVASLHQPSRQAFECFDQLLVLGYGGQVAFYGPARNAVAYFETATENPCPPSMSPGDYVLAQVFAPEDARRVVRYYERNHGGLPEPLAPEAPLPLAADPERSGWPQRLGRSLAQAWTLVQRNVRVLLADKPNLGLAFGQIPILALLILMAFHRLGQDGAEQERFTRIAYEFGKGRREQWEVARRVNPQEVLKKAITKSVQPTAVISRAAAQRRGVIYYILVAAAVWFGILGGCREVVTEKHILRREGRTCVDLGPYLGGKWVVLALQTGLQCGLLVVLVVPWVLQLSFAATVALWGVLWLTAVTSASLGLLLSSVAPTYRFALTAVPLLMIPQLLFGGILRPPADMAPGTWVARLPGYATVHRWAFQAALATDPRARQGVMVQQFPSDWDRLDTTLQLIEIIDFRKGSLLGSFFPEARSQLDARLPIVLLSIANPLLLLACHRWLKRRLF